MNELNFLDLAILKKVDPESTVEKFGGLINTSFFETANLLGTIKIKGYINIESSLGGISKVTLTDAGASLLVFAEQKTNDPIEPLDNAILHALAGGARELDALQHTLNIRSADLAYHVNKLVKQGFMDFEIRSAKVYFVLTETGFNSTGGVRVQQTLKPQESGGQKAGPEAPAESEEFAPGERGKETAQPKPAAVSSAPPWVNPAEVQPSAGEAKMKEDVAHIISERISIPRPEKKHEQPRPKKRKKRRKNARGLNQPLQIYSCKYAQTRRPQL